MPEAERARSTLATLLLKPRVNGQSNDMAATPLADRYAIGRDRGCNLVSSAGNCSTSGEATEGHDLHQLTPPNRRAEDLDWLIFWENPNEAHHHTCFMV